MFLRSRAWCLFMTVKEIDIISMRLLGLTMSVEGWMCLEFGRRESTKRRVRIS